MPVLARLKPTLELIAVSVFAVSTVWLRSAPAGAAGMILAGRIEAVAATDVGGIVARGQTVWLLDEHANPIRRLWVEGSAPLAARNRATAPSASEIPGVVTDSGWAAPYDPDDAEPEDDSALVDETAAPEGDRTGSRRRTFVGRREDAGSPVVVAAGGETGWVGRWDGLWRVDLRRGEASRVFASSGDGIRGLATSQDGVIVAFVSAGAVWRSRDAGVTFENTDCLAATTPRVLAATNKGNIFIGDDVGVDVIRAGAFQRRALGIGEVTQAVGCGEDALVIGAAWIHRMSDVGDGRTEVDRVRLPAGSEHLACGGTGAPWWADGAVLTSSRDGGRTWSPVAFPPATHVVAIAANRFGLWLGTAGGLVLVPSQEGASDDVTLRFVASERCAPAGILRRTAASPPPRWRWWYAGLPRLDLSLTTVTATSRREFRGFLMASFVVGRGAAGVARGAAFARELARRSMAGAPSILAVGPAGPGEPGTIECMDEESRAASRILGELR